VTIKEMVFYYAGAFISAMVIVVVQAVSGEMIKWYTPLIWLAVWIAWEVGTRYLKSYLEARKRLKEYSKGYRVTDRATLD
jgi:uncharacterized membrane protein YdcZ (DUF606 family)